MWNLFKREKPKEVQIAKKSTPKLATIVDLKDPTEDFV